MAGRSLTTTLALAFAGTTIAVFALVGSGFVLANRAQLTNVGGEGQIAIGGIARDRAHCSDL